MASSTVHAAKTTSTVHAAFVDGTHVFDIDGYSALKALGRRDDVTSGTFHVAGRDWNVVCGFDGGRLADVSLELAEEEDADGYVDHHDTVTAMVSFSIEDPTVGGRRKKPMRIGSRSSSSSRDDEDDDDDGQVVHFAHCSRSYKVAVTEAALQKLEARYVAKEKGDRLRVRCGVRVFKVSKPTTVRYSCFSATAPPADVTGFLKALLDSGRRADVTFAVDGSRRFDAHRLVLAMRSPVFRAMFFGDTRDSTVSWFRVRDVTAPVFAAVLHFIYTDELPAAADPDSAVETEDLLVAADLYGLDRLRLMCERVLWERVRADTESGRFGSAISTLALVNGRDSCRRLRKLCVDRVADDWEAATDTAEYRALRAAFPTLHGDVVESVISKGPPPTPTAPVTARSASVYRPSEVRRGRHEMTVVGHSVVRRTRGNGEFVSSGAFEVGGRDWRLLYFPSGWAAGERDASVVLQLLVPPHDAAILHDEDNPGVVVLAATGTIAVAGGKEGGGAKTRSAMIEHRYTNRKHTAAFRNVGVSGLVGPDDILRVECSFEFVQLAPMAAPSTTTARGRLVAQEEDIVVPPPSIAWHLARLLEDGLGADVTFSVDDDGEVEFHAHTLVISERAPALLLLPSIKTKKQQQKKTVRRVQGIKAAVFRALLHFVYTDELPPLDGLLGVVAAEAGKTTKDQQQQQVSLTATGLAGELLAAAERFHLVERLRPLCENLLCELVTPETAAATLQVARRLGRGDLRAFCLDYMTSPGVFKAVADSEGYRALPADALRDIVTQLAAAAGVASSTPLINTSTSS